MTRLPTIIAALIFFAFAVEFAFSDSPGRLWPELDEMCEVTHHMKRPIGRDCTCAKQWSPGVDVAPGWCYMWLCRQPDQHGCKVQDCCACSGSWDIHPRPKYPG